MVSPHVEHLTLVNPLPPIRREIDLFLLDCRARGLSPKTLEFYSNQLTYVTHYLTQRGAKDVTAIRPAHIRSYMVALTGQSRKPRTVHAA